MGYKKAMEVLPEEVLVLIQNYIDGEYIYIPKKEDNKKSWGESNKAKQMTHNRNCEIYQKYRGGCSVRELAELYCLSIKSIQGILIKLKRQAS